jgi:threonine dehydrogenase-like Zn-dependent dehydrogenase
VLAFVLEDGPPKLVLDRPPPVPGDRLVRVRTRLAGICNTDLELARGYMGFHGVLGHEFVGDALDGRLSGKRVVGGINFGCGRCERCSTGLERHCSARRVLGIVDADGTLAEEFLIPEENLVEVPAVVSDEQAVFAEPVAAAYEILEQLGSVQGVRALVIGDGKLGPLVAQVLGSEGADVTIDGRHLDQVAWLADCGVRLGSSQAQYDLVVDATGSREGLARAISLCRPRGTLVLKTTVAGKHEVDLAPVVIHELTIVGSRCGRIQPAIDRLERASVALERMISAEFPLRDVERAFVAAAQRGVRKVLVRPD